MNRRYDVVSSFGTLLAGFNGVDSQPEWSVGATGFNYRYDSLQATTVFGPPAPDPAIQGEAHVLSGDSGGPSWTFSMTGWELVGVHSSSQSHFGGGAEWVEEGDAIHDVRVGSYRQWIEDSCAAVVPEPSTIAALAGSLALFAMRRRGGRGRAKGGP
ncbi:MAG: PEP-CTERM sorting domain-containing protein [Fimbriimonadaceae bacterium]|nr:PEP-CTERM sorting domain-containing protein [Fimbriimonadaceae bacterium]